MSQSALFWILTVLHVGCLCGSEVTIEFTASPQPTAVLLGADLVLDCAAHAVTSDPVPSVPPPLLAYRWLLHAVSVSVSVPRAMTYTNHSLYVAGVQRAQLGRYQCEVSAEGGPRALSGTATVVQAYLSDFVLSPQSASVSAGSVLSLSCVSGLSAPPATLHWERDGERTALMGVSAAQYGDTAPGGATQRSLSLEITAWTDTAGSYRCVAYNTLTGETRASNAATVTVTAPPRAPYIPSPPPGDLQVAETSPITLECGILGHPQPAYSWTHDGTPLPDTARRYTRHDGSLVITATQRSDQGQYTCTGANALGSTAAPPRNLSVAYLDSVFVQRPSDLSVVAGQRVTLPCRPPPSAPPATVVWYRDGTEVVPRDGAFSVVVETGELRFGSVQMEDAGSYVCLAYNEHARPQSHATQPAVVTVEGSPQFTQPPADVRIVKGDLLTLTCKVKGHPTPVITWYKDGQTLAQTSRVIVREHGEVLVVADTHRLDAGQYRCTARNAHGTTRSQLAAVTVIVPPEVTSVLSDLKVTEGDSILLPCSFYGDPTPQVRWFKDGVSVPPGPRYILTVEGLVISVVERGDQGVYRCGASNEGGERQQSAELHVQIPPTFVAYPLNQTVNVSQSVIFYCEARGDPKPRVSWKFNGSSVLPPGVQLSADTSTLVVTATTTHHAGEYTCTAQSTLGMVVRTGTLLVQERPHVFSITGALEVKRGSPLELVCDVGGQPGPEVQWSLGGQPLGGQPSGDPRVELSEGGRRLRIDYAEPRDSGRYTCTAINAAGSHTRSVAVVVTDTPVAPFLSSVSPLSSVSINVSWIPLQQTTHSQILHYVVQYRARGGQADFTTYGSVPQPGAWLEVGGLQPHTQYTVRVASRGAGGLGGYSRQLSTTTLEAVPDAPLHLTLVSHNSTSLGVRWERPRTARGSPRTYQLQYRRTTDTVWSTVTIAPVTLPVQYHVLSALAPYTSYSLRVRAAYGPPSLTVWGRYTGTVVLTTSMAAPSVAPLDVLLTVTSPTEITAAWQPIPANSTHGPLLGYRLHYHPVPAPDRPLTLEVGTGLTARLVGLSPWRHYEVTVAGYNAAGEGVRSPATRARTTPTVPTGPPQDIRVEAENSTAITVTWKAVSQSERHSDISGYLVWYHAEGDQHTHSQHSGDPGQGTAAISNLTPWTIYEVKVQAFTTQVPDGFGPLSEAHRIRTQADVPGPPSAVTSQQSSNELTLTWQSPSQPNGVIAGYELTVTTQLAHSLRGRRSLVSVSGGEARQSFNLSGADHQVTVGGLVAGVTYTVGLAARTQAGRGAVWSTTVIVDDTDSHTDLPTTQVTTEVQTVQPSFQEVTVTEKDLSLEAVSPTLSPPGSGPGAGMVALVVGVVLGALLVITLTVLVVVCCCTHRGRHTHTDIYNSTRWMDSTEPQTYDPRQNKPGADFSDVTSTATLESEDSPGGSAEGGPGGQGEVPPDVGGHTGPTSVYTVPAVTAERTHTEHRLAPGFSNPGFTGEDGSPPRLRQQPANFTRQTDIHAHVRHSKKMRRSAAVAIAAQQNRESSVPPHGLPDTDRPAGDTHIVYNERTAL